MLPAWDEEVGQLGNSPQVGGGLGSNPVGGLCSNTHGPGLGRSKYQRLVNGKRLGGDSKLGSWYV